MIKLDLVDEFPDLFREHAKFPKLNEEELEYLRVLVIGERENVFRMKKYNVSQEKIEFWKNMLIPQLRHMLEQDILQKMRRELNIPGPKATSVKTQSPKQSSTNEAAKAKRASAKHKHDSSSQSSIDSRFTVEINPNDDIMKLKIMRKSKLSKMQSSIDQNL